MRKSNWIILGVLVVASIFFLWLWYYLQFNLIDNPLDLVLTIIWWAVVLVACFAIKKAEDKRQERIRTTFVSADKLFNTEAGLISKTSNSAVEAIEQSLANLEYNFHMEDFPTKQEARFDYIVHSKKFEFEKNDEAAGAESAAADQTAQAAGAATPITVKEWEGEVVTVARPDDEPQKFSSREELVAILAA